MLPDHTGIGATPAWRAKAASLLNRVTPAVSPTSLAAVNSAQPGSARSAGRRCGHARRYAWQRVDGLGEAGDVGQLVTGQFSDQSGLGRQPVAQKSAVLSQVQLARLGCAFGIEFMHPPQQPANHRSTLPDKIFTTINEQLEFS